MKRMLPYRNGTRTYRWDATVSRDLLVSISFFLLSIQLDAQFYAYDFGLIEASGYQKIELSNELDEFTWLIPPQNTFEHDKYREWRTPSWHDGVIGKQLRWECNIPDGSYEVYLFLDSGLELTSTWSVSLNDEKYPLGLHPVRNSVEPSNRIAPHVKIWRGSLLVQNNRLNIHLTGGNDSIRLLACHLVSTGTPGTSPDETKNWLLEMMSEYGRFSHQTKSLRPIMDNVQTYLNQHPNDGWSFKLFHEVSWLNLAEHFDEVRGWQWSTNHYDMSMIQKYQQAQMLLDPIVQEATHPLFERALWLRARICFHLHWQYGHTPDQEQARRDLDILLQKFPQDTLLRMYAGQFFKNQEDDISIYPNAPKWSQLQVRALHRLRKLVHYWVKERQAPNGEMGGKYGDDVEAIRFWPPLVYTGDSLAILGLRRLADGVWYSDEIQNGFAKDIADVEHSAEFISDTGPLIIAATDENRLHERALPTAQLMADLWTTRDANGQLFFKSSWYSSSGIDERSPRNRDVPMNTRTTKILRYYLWRYPDSSNVRNLLYDWTKSWVGLAKNTEKGKPMGILPASFRASDGAINGDEPNWYDANMFWPYYNFRGDVMMLDQMLFLSNYFNDPELLYPIEAAIQLVKKYGDKGGTAGTAEWAAAKFLESKGFYSLISQWRLLTNSPDYDDVVLKYGTSYLAYRMTGDLERLEKSLMDFNEDLGYNWKMMTTDTWFTDRIWAAGPNSSGRVNSDVIKAMLTGDTNLNGTSPYMVVTWDKVEPGFTALVNESTDHLLHIDLFNHAQSDQQVIARLWNLEPGEYHLMVNDDIQQSFIYSAPGDQISISLPSGQVTRLRIELR